MSWKMDWQHNSPWSNGEKMCWICYQIQYFFTECKTIFQSCNKDLLPKHLLVIFCWTSFVTNFATVMETRRALPLYSIEVFCTTTNWCCPDLIIIRSSWSETCFDLPCHPSLPRNDVQSVKNALIASSLAFVPIIVLRQNTDGAPNLTSI